MRKDIQNAWMQMWSPPARFERAELEQKFLATYCLQSAPHRRSAVILGIAVSLLYVVWDFFNWKADPAYRESFNSILATRVGTVTELMVVLGFASFARFEWDERYASNVLFFGCFVNFIFYSISFQLVPYPYDYMYFFVGMFINVVFGFAMLRMRARPVLWLMVLCMGIALCAFVGNGQLKQASLDTPAAKIYQGAALIFFFTVAMIGFIVANLLERTTRMSFSRTEELAVSNQNLVSHAEKVEQLNSSLQTAVTRVKQESAARARVLASASHDLRQPLHALSIYSAILVAAPNPHRPRSGN